MANVAISSVIFLIHVKVSLKDKPKIYNHFPPEVFQCGSGASDTQASMNSVQLDCNLWLPFRTCCQMD